MSRQKILVIGGGFAGLQCVHSLRGADADIILIDRRNHHLFQPLLYQAATSLLSPTEIAWPLRQIFRRRQDVTVLLGEVEAIDPSQRTVLLDDRQEIAFDILVVATGVSHAYFGHEDWREFAPGLKSVSDAAAIRNRLLAAFERAEMSESAAEREALLTFAVIGGGATGVELAGVIADLAQSAFPREFRRIDTRSARILLVEAGERILPAFHPLLSQSALEQLQRRGVEVRLGTPVTRCAPQSLTIGSEEVAAHTLLWAAGVEASPAARWLGADADKAGRTMVEPDLSISGDRSIFVIGDTAHVRGSDGSPVPGLAPAAKQQGQYVARLIRDRMAGRETLPFRYHHQGSLATIGHRAAVAQFGRIRLSGRLAWWLWGLVHIYFLIGTRSRMAVAASWLWTYLKGEPSARLIDEKAQAPSERRVE